MISSGGRAASEQSEKMGTYHVMAGVVINNAPVWKHQNNEKYLVCDSNGRWLVGCP